MNNNGWCVLKQDASGRWVLSDRSGRFGWSGKRWVRISYLGVPSSEVSKYATREEACAYAQQAGFEVRQ